MKKLIMTLCMAALAGIVSSCGSSKNAVSLATIEGEWNIIEINGEAVVPAPGQAFPNITFDTANGRVSGNSGCNRMFGGFDAKGKPGKLELGRMGSTMMMCPDMEVERAVLKALSEVKGYKSLDKGNVALCDGNKKPVVVLKRK